MYIQPPPPPGLTQGHPSIPIGHIGIVGIQPCERLGRLGQRPAWAARPVGHERVA